MRKLVGSEFEAHESRTFSQNGEDGVLAHIFDVLGTTTKFFVEFGVGADGRERNTRLLEEQHGWQGLLMDSGASDRSSHIRKEKITAENINDLFVKYDVPGAFDLLSIDIDGNDYWVWKAIGLRYRPRVLVMEYNASVPPPRSATIEYDPGFRWNGTDYFGASLTALERLSRRKGYALVYCERRGVNAFFVQRDLLSPSWERPVEEIYREPGYGAGGPFGLAQLLRPRGRGRRPDRDRVMIDVD